MFRNPITKKIPAFVLVCVASTMAGCLPGGQGSATADIGLPVVSGGDLSNYLRVSESPVLVEFGVDFNCPRCAQIKNGVVRLRETLKGEVDVIRVDFNSNAQTVADLGGTLCPTYVLFDKGQHLLTKSFPVSIDLLEGEVLRQIGN